MTTRTLTLADELLLLALNDETGAVHSSASMALDFGLAGALLMELALNDRLDTDGKKLAVADRRPLGNPILDDALRAIAESPTQRTPQDWVNRLSRALGGLRQRLLDDLVANGTLERREGRLLLIFPVTRYPEHDGRIEDDLRAALDRVLLENQEPDQRTALLVRLIKSCELISVLYGRERRKMVKARIDELAAREIYGQAVDQAIQGAQAAVNAAIIASTVAATSASTAACSASTAANC